MNTEQAKQPQAARPTMKVERDVKVTMRDGVRISLCVYRPRGRTAGAGAVRGLALPARIRQRARLSAVSLARDRPGRMVCEPGYAYVHADVRGSGQSEGEFGFMDRTEQEDYVELIAWIAKQPWCTGRVGGIGQSYYAMAQWLMATLNPPALACIVPYDGLVDQYRCSNYHGGIFCNYRSSWYANLRADNQHRPAGAKGRPPMRFDLVGAITEHTLYDDWWRERSPYERLGEIKVPVLSIGHWGKMGLHLRGNILGFEEVKAPKKLVVTGAQELFRSASPVRPDRIPREGDAAVLRGPPQGHRQRIHGRRAGAAVRPRHRRVARGTGMAARRARPMCPTICARARPAA